MLLLKRILSTGLLLLLVSYSFAQNKNLVGKVLDTLDRPIAYANVVAVNQTTQKIGGFSISDADGRFKIGLVPGSEYLLRVTFVGYRQFELKLTEWTDQELLKIVLSRDETMLDQVEVVTELPITMKGDTLTYKTDAFTTGTERKLREVLEKLPGFEVDDNGEVKVQGKKVDKVMVDGKNFFDGDTKLATKNLPANAVDRVQVLKNYNEIAPVRGLDNDENLALNIQLKDGKKNMVFGDVSAGAGSEERYLGHVNAFYYAPKVNLNLIADANNVGELAFTLQDYFRFSGGLANLSGKSGSTLNVNAEDMGIPMAQRNNARDLRTELAAVNLNYNPSSRWLHSGFLIGSASKNKLGSSSQRTYLRTDENNQETLTSVNTVENKSGLLKYAVTFTPKEETYVKYSFFGKLADIGNQNFQDSDFGNTQQQVISYQSRQPYAIQQKGEWFHAPSDKRVFSMEVNWEKKYQNPLYDLTTSQNPFGGLVPLLDRDTYRFLQNQDIKTRTVEGVFNYYAILNPTNHFNWSLGYTNTGQSLVGSVDQGDTSLEEGLQEFENDSRFDFQDLYLGMTYKTKWKSLIISPSLYLHNYTWIDTQMEEKMAHDKLLLLPGMYAKWNIRSNRSLTYRFSTQTNFMDIQKLAQGLVISDYNSVFRGNRQLDNGLFYTQSIGYNHFDFFSSLNIFGNLSWTRKHQDLVNTTDFSGINRILSVRNIAPVNESLTASLNGDKRFQTFKVSGGGNWNNYSTNSLVDQNLVNNSQFTHSYFFKFTSTFMKTVEVDLGYSWDQNFYKSTNARNTFSTHSPKIEVDWDIWKGLKLNSDYTYNAYLNKASATTSTFDFLNAFLSYQGKSSPWEFRLTVWNILDTRSIRRDSFTENLISTYSYLVQPRYGLLSVKWDL
ncbi:carboxypeptidase-like regulatory domain-containing protein [Algoriphagus sp. AGSA1]|uniref:carboxypeptidase regulatory-like domain-containing protein n=1 Tax=Algoriphagus sp. AGSA1 TaxID=2907213 RepID=UPI001F3DF967|nr:carboxypeptidase regulatory-like domain-containing protein [Algoriphagus sp. AGSA1]MCE7056107.1 carboxypeptidase-like regulatory domain-containing protein [Algoriphagus sp. AGSA1]